MILRSYRLKIFADMHSSYVDFSEELDRCGLCFAKLMKYHVSACMVLNLTFTFRRSDTLLRPSVYELLHSNISSAEILFWNSRKS